MGISRSASSLIAAAGRHLINARPFYTKGNFAWRVAEQHYKPEVDGIPADDGRVTKINVTASVTPEGRWNANLIAEFWPYLGTSYYQGEIVNKSADKTLVSHGADGGLLTVLNAVVTQMPEIVFSSDQSLLGSVEFSAALDDGADPDDADSLFTYAESGGTFADTTFALADIKTQAYKLTIADLTGLTDVVSSTGFRFTPRVTLDEVYYPDLGLLGWRFRKVEAALRFTPVGPTRANILAAAAIMGSGAVQGRSKYASAKQATLVGADGVTYLTMPKTVIIEHGYVFGQPLRTGEVALMALPNFSTGSYAGIATLAAS